MIADCDGGRLPVRAPTLAANPLGRPRTVPSDLPMCGALFARARAQPLGAAAGRDRASAWPRRASDVDGIGLHAHPDHGLQQQLRNIRLADLRFVHVVGDAPVEPVAMTLELLGNLREVRILAGQVVGTRYWLLRASRDSLRAGYSPPARIGGWNKNSIPTKGRHHQGADFGSSAFRAAFTARISDALHIVRLTSSSGQKIRPSAKKNTATRCHSSQVTHAQGPY